jgi:hypothetical protein
LGVLRSRFSALTLPAARNECHSVRITIPTAFVKC